MLRTLHDLQSKDVAAAANFLGTLPALMATGVPTYFFVIPQPQCHRFSDLLVYYCYHEP